MPSRHQDSTMSTPAPSEVYNKNVYLTAMIASMGAFIFGYDLAFIGTTITLKPFEQDFGLVDASQAMSDAFSANIVSLLQAGCFFGSLAVAPIGDKLGRKKTLTIAGLTFCVGSLMQTVSRGSVAAMFVGRVVGGLGVGLASGIVPLYVAELAPPAIRGRLVGVYEISVQTGTCVGFWICYGVDKHISPTSAQWVTPFAVQLIPGGLLVIGMIFIPESPRWLARFGTRDAASKVLSELRNLPTGHPYLEEELNYIMVGVSEDFERLSGGRHSKWKSLRTPSNRRRIFLGTAVFIFMQFAGSNAINYYSHRIFKSVGLTGSSTSLYATGIYGIVRLVCVTIAMYFCVDRFGRRKMLIGGAAVMLVSMWFIGAYIKIASPDTSSSLTAEGYAAVAFIYVFAVGFCFSYAGIPWILCSEIFPSQVRAIGMAIVTAVHWLLNLVIARSVPYMISNIGYGTYFVFASCITLSIPFVYFCLPETKGLTLEEVDGLFSATDQMAATDAELQVVKHVEDTRSVHVEHSGT